MFFLKSSQFLQRLTADSKPTTHKLLDKTVKKIKDILTAHNNHTFTLKLFSIWLFPNFVYINVFLKTTGEWTNVYHKFLSNTHMKRNNSMQECKGGRAAWTWEDLDELQRTGAARHQPEHFHRKPTEWKTCETGYFNLFRSNAHSIKKNSSGGCLFAFRI